MEDAEISITKWCQDLLWPYESVHYHKKEERL